MSGQGRAGARQPPPCWFVRDQLRTLRGNEEFWIGNHVAAFFEEDEQRAAALWPNGAANDGNLLDELLACSCDRCDDDRDYVAKERSLREYTLDDRRQRVKDWILGREGKPRSTSLLALLTDIHRPQLIYAFIAAKRHDGNLAAKLDAERPHEKRYLTQTCLSFLEPLAGSSLNSLCDDFLAKRHAYLLPKLYGASTTVQRYSSKAILPFVGNDKIDSGASSQVYGFTIPNEYYDEKFSQGYTKFARKEFRRSSDQQTMEDESRVLQYVNQLKNKHIITMLKAYQHGDMFNIIFPRYEKNLNDMLRMKGRVPGGKVSSHQAWQQFYGVLDAMVQFSSRSAPRGSRDANRLSTPEALVQRGYHLDLKPKNILLDKNARWIIADFGQAYLHQDGNTERVGWHGCGTEAYAPPEARFMDAKLYPKYDVWSLGCLALEIIMYTVDGSTAVINLDKARRHDRRVTTPNTTHYYWVDIDDPKEIGKRISILKPAVQELIKQTTKGIALDAADQAFLQQVSSIVIGEKAMLGPLPALRMSLVTARDQFRELLQKYQTASRPNTSQAMPLPQPIVSIPDRASQNATSTSIKGLESEYSYCEWCPSFNRSEGRLYDIEAIYVETPDNKKFTITSTSVDNNIPARRQEGVIAKSLFIPLYAYNADTDPSFTSCHFCFCFAKHDAEAHSRDKCLSFAVQVSQTNQVDTWFGADGAHAAQLKATGQEVICSRGLETFRLKHRRGFRRPKDFGSAAENVQIWKQSIVEGRPSKSRSSPIYRLVIFSGRSMYIMLIDGYWTLEHESAGSNELFFVNYPNQAEFICYSLGPNTPQSKDNTSKQWAGIPIYSYNLQSTLEKSTGYNVEKLKLHFHNDKHAKDFATKFNKVESAVAEARAAAENRSG